MAAERENMIFPLRWFDTLSELEDNELREMLSAIGKYAATGEAPTFKGAMKALWNEIQNRIDADNEKYEAVKELNRQKAQKRWSKSEQAALSSKAANADAYQNMPSDAAVCRSMPSDAAVCRSMPSDAKNADGDGKGDLQKKMIAKAIPKENGFSFADFPENLKCDEFLAKWREWEQYRRKTRKTVSAFAAKKQLNELAKWDVKTAMAMIDESIKNDWQGIFPLKPTNGNNNTSRYGRQPIDEDAVSKRAAHLREVFGDDFEGVEG